MIQFTFAPHGFSQRAGSLGTGPSEWIQTGSCRHPALIGIYPLAAKGLKCPGGEAGLPGGQGTQDSGFLSLYSVNLPLH